MTSLVEDDREIICHEMLIPYCRQDRDLIEGDLVLRVFLAVIFFSFSSLKLSGQTTCRRCEEKRAMSCIVLDAAHVFVCCSVTNAPVDAFTSVLVREVLP